MVYYLDQHRTNICSHSNVNRDYACKTWIELYYEDGGGEEVEVRVVE